MQWDEVKPINRDASSIETQDWSLLQTQSQCGTATLVVMLVG
jgi:hypothetical protein